MTAAKALPPLAQVKGVLDYDPETGIFRWKHRDRDRPNGGFTRSGHIAGSVYPCGHRYISVAEGKYPAHRLAWLWVHGVEPAVHIDHKNGNADDNRICNLREADTSQNIWNSRRRKKKYPRGVKRQPKYEGYAASIVVRGKYHHIGTFKTAEEAGAAYRAKAVELHGEFAP